jgi:hypothetical protein
MTNAIRLVRHDANELMRVQAYMDISPDVAGRAFS